ncbi:hypothetical protein WDU94_000284 [Cyamophila willieti]
MQAPPPRPGPQVQHVPDPNENQADTNPASSGTQALQYSLETIIMSQLLPDQLPQLRDKTTLTDLSRTLPNLRVKRTPRLLVKAIALPQEENLLLMQIPFRILPQPTED